MSIGRTVTLVKTLRAGAAIADSLILKLSTDGESWLPSASATDASLATSTFISSNLGESCDGNMGGICEVKLGGTVTAGASLTSNASAQAIATTTAGNRCVGYALSPGVANQIIAYLYAPHVY